MTPICRSLEPTMQGIVNTPVILLTDNFFIPANSVVFCLLILNHMTLILVQTWSVVSVDLIGGPDKLSASVLYCTASSFD